MTKTAETINYVIEVTNFDAARPYTVIIASTKYLNRVKGRYASRKEAMARIRSLQMGERRP